MNGALYVKDIKHNAKGQRTAIYYGNDSMTRYCYHAVTQRLTHLITTAKKGTVIHQNLKYYYDPVGNITCITDHTQQTVYFNNTQISPTQKFTYDALYRLAVAKGREMYNGIDEANANKNAFTPYASNIPTGNSNALLQYTQQYTYDKVGNITQLHHNAGANTYTRNYQYATNSNQLATVDTNPNPSFIYTYDAHGNITRMPHLATMLWNTHNQLATVAKNADAPTTYQYSGGQRIRKHTKLGDNSEQRIYFGGLEIYRKFTSSSLTLERHTIHIADDQGRIAMQENLIAGNDDSDKSLTRYIYSNHLQSSALELDNFGKVISYEEYHPFGTTSYHVKNSDINAIAKRYRYTGKERDEESGLYYHGARYYIPWLCRWCAVDPLESKYAGLSSYHYSFNNPVMFNDPSGMGGENTQFQSPTNTNQYYSWSGGNFHIGTYLPEVVVKGQKFIGPLQQPSNNPIPFLQKKAGSASEGASNISNNAKSVNVSSTSYKIDPNKFFDFMQYQAINYLEYDTNASISYSDVCTFSQRTMNTIANGGLSTLDIIVNRSSFNNAMSSAYNWSINPANSPYNLLVKFGQNLNTENVKSIASNPDTYSTGLGMLLSMKAIPKGGGNSFASKSFNSNSGFQVGNGGNYVLPMQVVKEIPKDTKIKDLIETIQARTHSTGMEHAVVRLGQNSIAPGARVLVSGGRDGIYFANNEITFLWGHSHPYVTGASLADFNSLYLLNQSKQYITEAFNNPFMIRGWNSIQKK
jgi:RHS repeat-associated protein